MSWVKENKFLAGFLGATVAGAGVLGYLLFQAKGQYDEQYAAYQQEASELNRLEGLQPYPNAENLKKLEAQRDEYLSHANQLVAAASALEFELPKVTATEFQDKLRSAVDETNQRAAAKNIKVPERFSLGFERYLTDLPRPEAAAPLARQLAAVKLVADAIIDSQVSEIRAFTRQELPEERGAGAAENASKNASGKSAKTLVETHPIQLDLVGKQPQIRNALNKIVTSDQQFYIPRLITVNNEKQDGPSRLPDGGFHPSPPPGPGDIPTPPQPGAPKYIVGEENIEFTLLLEIADFAEIAAAK